LKGSTWDYFLLWVQTRRNKASQETENVWFELTGLLLESGADHSHAHKGVPDCRTVFYLFYDERGAAELEALLKEIEIPPNVKSGQDQTFPTWMVLYWFWLAVIQRVFHLLICTSNNSTQEARLAARSKASHQSRFLAVGFTKADCFAVQASNVS
jgi:hypothetical protein